MTHESPHFSHVIIHWHCKEVPFTKESIDASQSKCVAFYSKPVFYILHLTGTQHFAFMSLFDILLASKAMLGSQACIQQPIPWRHVNGKWTCLKKERKNDILTAFKRPKWPIRPNKRLHLKCCLVFENNKSK